MMLAILLSLNVLYIPLFYHIPSNETEKLLQGQK